MSKIAFKDWKEKKKQEDRIKKREERMIKEQERMEKIRRHAALYGDGAKAHKGVLLAYGLNKNLKRGMNSSGKSRAKSAKQRQMSAFSDEEEG